MRLLKCLSILAAALSFCSARADVPRLSRGSGTIHGGPAMQTKAVGDTINLMASHDDPTNESGEPLYLGDFENGSGIPDWNGWTSLDATAPTEHHWQVSNYFQVDPGNLAAWCGDINFPSCDDSLDPAGGYGNSWNEILEFRQAVPDPAVSSLVTLTGNLDHDTEPGYDFVYLSVRPGGEPYVDLAWWDGRGTIDLSQGTTFLPADYENGTDVVLYFRFKSDGGWSDEDCAWPTAGALRLDDLGVHLVNGGETLDSFTDFQDGTFGDWAPVPPVGVGDFAQIWTGLQDIDPCVDNFSPQVAFIDDGVVVPGTGGSECINWCYGPQGYIVNTTGGLAGPAEHIHDLVISPVMDWPNADYDGALFTFGVFRHEDLSPDAPGMFYIWGVRSADTDGSGGSGVQDIAAEPWEDRNFLYYGGPGYIRDGNEVTDLMNPGRDQVQVMLGILEIGWYWGWVGNDGYPAPYFDNVKFQVFDQQGPGMTAREIDLANDGFPERGSLDFEDLGSMSVRFDMAKNIALATHGRIDFGDSIVVDIAAVREGAELHGTPELRYKLWPNPVFDPYRTAGLPTQGSVSGFYATTPTTEPPYDWAFDLPDTGFLFPGDVLHYYLWAQESIDGADIRTAIMPADTTGFSAGPDDPLAYNSTFVIHALPTIRDDGFGGYETPPILFWNDFANRGGENEWYHALRAASMRCGEDYDIYYTNGPSSGVGNGLGGRAGSDLVLELYTDMLYTCGDLGINTLSNGDFNNDPSDDVGVLTAWLLQGGKDLFLTGDDLASDLAVNAGPEARNFAEEFMGLSWQQQDVRSFIDNQMSPRIQAAPGNPVFQTMSGWVAFGGCPGINTFDGVTARVGAFRLAEFVDPSGSAGAYPFSAATLNIPGTPGTSRIVSLPYDLMFVRSDPDISYGIPLAARSLMMRDLVNFFGLLIWPDPVPVPPDLVFTAANHPNPFNPSTRIVYTIPRAGHLSLKVYDLRGRLVRTLVDGRVPSGADQVAVWDGTDDRGAAVSSGVYFYEARTGGEVKVGKMALVK